MAKNPQQLNQKQLDVLRWIRDGCPDGVYTEGWEHRIVARALERRGLSSISGQGPSWRASMTAAGRQWLEAPPVADVIPDDTEGAAFIDRVLAADGKLVIEDPHESDLKPYERLIRLSLKSSRRPHGKQLALRREGGWTSRRWIICFENYAPDYVESRPVAVPERVGKYHPVARAYLDDVSWQYVSKEHVSRAARVLHALASEAERRGVKIQLPAQVAANKDRHKRHPMKGHLWFVTSDGDYSVEIREIPGTGGAKRDYSYSPPKGTPTWIWRRNTEFVSTGRLELILDGRRTPYQGQHFRDAKATRVEDKLGDVFAALERYEIEAGWAEERRVREGAERRRRWEAALENAKREFAWQARWDHFSRMVAQQDDLKRRRVFLDAAVAAAETLAGEEHTAVLTYLDEMHRAVDKIDPLAEPKLIVPEVPTPTEAELAPLMKGWSPYGPSAR
ncbi:hypothetical protein M4I32_02305 [Microbacterium sp. LRZ72]|uniref:hypothetical protein n=1 Tax=Microbacterium sp. LRZ72 TaxID=2942481 RepID=UPI0029B63A18|nr:hypothetical protein [Microbacterium sp. LRZ72]MDX2375629.1 hypothetical protein [Microbacterium sp. LRZ72]